MRLNPTPSGVTGKGEKDMTTHIQAHAQTRPDTGLAGIALASVAGIFLLAVAGFAQSAVLHDATHDQRHAVAFPCH